MAEHHGFQPHVLVLTPKELREGGCLEPLPCGRSSAKSLHLYFRSGVPKTPVLKSMRGAKAESEAFALTGRNLYLHTPDGFGKSKLAGRVEGWLGVEATARNCRTVSMLLELAKGYD
jgi:uncharacterized protein (DUF1697 family)